MTHQLKPIVITPEQIIAAAQKIVDSHGDSWEHTADEYLAATEHWLRTNVNNLLTGAEWYANQSDSSFDLSSKCALPRCNDLALLYSPNCETHAYYDEAGTAKELVMPAPPEWAHDTINHAPANEDAMLNATAEQMYGELPF